MNKPHVWTRPEENWSMLPNEFIDIIPQIETLAEMKVILYVLRHTWGYSDQYKKITMDEFINGRKRKDGSRIDNGLGMSPVSIRDGIKRAVAHGYIVVMEDNDDMARQKRFYSLASIDSEPESACEPDDQKLTPRGSETDHQMIRNLPSDDQKLIIGGSETDHRTEKETIERNYKKKDDHPALSTVRNSEQPSGDGDDHPPGALLRSLLDGAGFVYRDRNLKEIAVKLEDSYTAEQLVRAVGAAKDAHTKQIMDGKKGIMAPAAYVASVLADAEKKPQPATKQKVRIYNQYTEQYEYREVMV